MVGSPKMSATIVGFSHKSMGSNVVGLAGQLNRCTVWSVAGLHEGQQSKVTGMLALQLLQVLAHPNLCWARMVLIILGSGLSFTSIDGGCRLISLLWLRSSLAVVTVVHYCCYEVGDVCVVVCEVMSHTARYRIVHDYIMVGMEWRVASHEVYL